MASLLELFENSEFQDQIKKNSGDKTPLSIDGGTDLIADDNLVDQARGGPINKTPYSSTVRYN